MLVANIGLYVFWRAARALYLVVIVAAVLGSIYLGPSANSGVADFLETAMNVVSGMILGLVYYSDVREAFEPPAIAAPPAPVPMPVAPIPPIEPMPAAATPQTGLATAATPAFACANCGAPWAGKKFCEECGASFAKAQCEQCGAELTPGKKFCGECGGPVR